MLHTSSQDSCAYLAFKSGELPRHIKQLLDALQMIEVLMAMTDVVGQHAANQAQLVSLAEPLTKALAAWLSTFPLVNLEATDAPAASLTEGPSCGSTSTQSDTAALTNSSTWAEPKSTAHPTAAHDSSCNTQKTTCALTSRLKAPKQISLLTAQLRNTAPSKAETLAPSAPPQGAASNQRGKSSKKRQRHEDEEVQLARRFAYHLLLHLPVDVLKDRQAFWMEHAVGLPQLMHCCLGVAVMQEPTVSQHHTVHHCAHHVIECIFSTL